MKCPKCKRNFEEYEFNENGICSRCEHGEFANIPGEDSYIKKMGDNILTPEEEKRAIEYEETLFSSRRRPIAMDRENAKEHEKLLRRKKRWPRDPKEENDLYWFGKALEFAEDDDE